MKMYRLINLVDNEVVGKYHTRQDAVSDMEDSIECFNDDEPDEEKQLTPFDFKLEEIESNEINDIVTDYEIARAYLGGKPNNDFTVSQKVVSRNTVKLDDASILVNELNPSHVKALIAMNRLFTIAEAWNKADGFVPDWEDKGQGKWFPWFYYDTKTAGFASANANNAPSRTHARIGSRLCFKSPSRAKQFGEQFIDLWNEVLLF
jgi:hypothetical protein